MRTLYGIIKSCTVVVSMLSVEMATVDNINAVNRFPQLQFQYKDPERGFDRRAVHGLVATLITVKDPATATALEVSAGGRVSILYRTSTYVNNCVLLLSTIVS